jgi:hypothetical protein
MTAILGIFLQGRGFRLLLEDNFVVVAIWFGVCFIAILSSTVVIQLRKIQIFLQKIDRDKK